MRVVLCSLGACLILTLASAERAAAQAELAGRLAIAAVGPSPLTAPAPPLPVLFANPGRCQPRATGEGRSGYSTLFRTEGEHPARDHYPVDAWDVAPFVGSRPVCSSSTAAVLAGQSSSSALDVRRVEPGPIDLRAVVERGGGGEIRLARQEPNPLPEHTGLKTLAKDTVSDFAAFPRRKSTWVFLGAGLGAALLAHQADDYVAEHIVGSEGADKSFKLGKVVGSAGFQTGSALSLWLIGRYLVPKNEDGSRSNRLSHLGLDLLRAQIMSQATVRALKYSVQQDRPTGECCAFPSGHAASAFSSAAVFERHFGERGSWWALTAASYVAASRLVDNRHFLSDVVFGAALGEAVGWTVVGRHGRDRYVLRAVPVRGGGMVVITSN